MTLVIFCGKLVSMNKFTLRYNGGYNVKRENNTLRIYIPSNVGKNMNPQVPTHIMAYLKDEGFLDDILDGVDINIEEYIEA